MPEYKGLDDESISEYVRIASETADTIIKDLTRESVFDPNMIQALTIVEREIKKRKLVVYGGTALNSILPESLQFYDTEYDLPDWDFFSDNPIIVAVNIADYVKDATGLETAVVTAAHEGTYKVFADGQAIADITYVSKKVLKIMREHAILKNGIYYSGPDYLRMSAYLEMSRPLGQPDRWEKVIKRISLLNRAYPIIVPSKDDQKDTVDDMVYSEKMKLLEKLIKIQNISTKRVDTEEGDLFAFIGPEIFSLVKRILTKGDEPPIKPSRIPGGILLMSPTPEQTAKIISNVCESEVTVISREGAGEFLGDQYVIYSGKTQEPGYELCTIVGVIDACQSVHTIRVTFEDKMKGVRIGSIESMVYVYSALVFADDIGSMTYYSLRKAIDDLIKLHIRVLKEQKRPLLPFEVECIGKQLTIKDMRQDKTKDIRRILRSKGKSSIEYIRRNIRYEGGDKYARKNIEKLLNG